jgi:hypothetical protein
VSSGFQSIPVVPKGWELVGLMEPNPGDWFLCLHTRKPRQWRYAERGTILFAIIRKVEPVKRYRPFSSQMEAKSMIMAKVMRKDIVDVAENNRFEVSGLRNDGAIIGYVFYKYRDAFDAFVKMDGTPFGMEVTSE